MRVFISSTLDLEAERAAARDAVRRLHLTPVMFELGARPHPPRALYRAYLEQSDVFVGIYARRYGWIAPGEPVSGLEDEYRLAGDRPRLIYVARAPEGREPRLEALLQRVQDDDRATYRAFGGAGELGALLEEDLATLLSERFQGAGAAAPGQAPAFASRLPVPSTSFVGRDADVRAVRGLLCRERARLVTLTGPGGIGKTRLALEVARGLAGRFRDGAVPVFLETLPAGGDVAAAIADALRIAETPGLTRRDMLAAYVRDRRMLLLLDNFEHVIGAAPVVAALLAAAPGLRVLVTSREVLNVRGERGYAVGPLDVPPGAAAPGVLLATGAGRLFRDRASAVAPGFRVDDESAAPIAEVCRRLEGLPLAIELAAARARHLSPAELAARLGDRLDLLVQGPRDLPERQRTLRATIAWSHDLLGEEERRLFARLGVFVGGFTLEAVEAVCAPGGDDPLELLSSLLDKSLLRAGRAGSTRLAMLDGIRAFALERLRAAGEAEPLRRRHAAWFRAWVEGASADYERELGRQAGWVARLSGDMDNVRAALRWHLDASDAAGAASMAMALWPCWWIRSHFTEARAWMEEALRAEGLGGRDRARALLVDGLAAVGQNDYAHAVRRLAAARAGFEAARDERGAALAAVPLGVGLFVAGDAAAGERAIREALAISRRQGDAFGVACALFALGRVLMLQGRLEDGIAAEEEAAGGMRRAGELMLRSLSLLTLGWAYVVSARLDRAAAVVDEALAVLSTLQNAEGIARGLEVAAAVAQGRGDAGGAARLLGAAEGTRRSIGARPWLLDGRFREALEASVHGALSREAFERARAEGLSLPCGSAIALARTAVAGGEAGLPAWASPC